MKTTKKKIGLVLFWFGVFWAFFWGILGSIHQVEYYSGVLTLEQLNDTIWATTGPLMTIWGFSPPLAVVIAGIGLLLYSGAKRLTVWLFGIGIILLVYVVLIIQSLGHFAPLFAIAATLILLFFFRILWLWAKERKDLEGRLAVAADLRLTGYAFFFISAWFTCGITGPAWQKALVDIPLMDPIFVMIFHLLGWFFLLLSHYKSRKQ